MPGMGKWLLTLGIMAMTPGLTMAGPFGFGSKSSKADSAKEPAAVRIENQRVAEEIAVALRKARINGQDIEIEYLNGTATLRGQISDAGQKARVTQLISRIEGVKLVNNQMTVMGVTTAAGQSASPFGGAPRQQPVQTAAWQSPAGQGSGLQQVSGFEPATSPLSGGPDANQKTAEQIASALSKVKLTGYDIEIRYQDGVARLLGSVGTPAQRALASRVTSGVPGVQRVDNQLRVTQQGQPQRQPFNPQTAAAYGPRGPISPAAFQPGGQQAPTAGQPPMPPNGAGGPPMGPGGPMGPMGPMGPGGAYPGGAYPGGPGYPGAAGYPGGPGGPGGPVPPYYGQGGPAGGQPLYNHPNLPDYAWPSYASYPNSAAVTYPQQYSASAWPYIGPFYPYPQVPLGWRQVQLEWDDGQWKLNFRPRTDKWWWFLHPENW